MRWWRTVGWCAGMRRVSAPLACARRSGCVAVPVCLALCTAPALADWMGWEMVGAFLACARRGGGVGAAAVWLFLCASRCARLPRWLTGWAGAWYMWWCRTVGWCADVRMVGAFLACARRGGGVGAAAVWLFLCASGDPSRCARLPRWLTGWAGAWYMRWCRTVGWCADVQMVGAFLACARRGGGVGAAEGCALEADRRGCSCVPRSVHGSRVG
eukprot:COSAG01_NODE_3429_length_6104_cov_67.418748_1_plen_214_part_00